MGSARSEGERREQGAGGAPDDSIAATVSASGLGLVIIDDNRLYREALADVLRHESWVEHMEAGDGSDATDIERCAQESTVTLLNMSTEGSLALLRELSDAGARVVVLGVRETEAEVIACAEAGSSGYALRSDSLERLCEVVQAVARGESICSPKTTAALLRRIARLAAERRSHNGVGSLTAREAEILELIELGQTNREIAERLHIELRTVKNHVHAILGKLGVARRGQAVALVRSARAR